MNRCDIFNVYVEVKMGKAIFPFGFILLGFVFEDVDLGFKFDTMEVIAFLT